MSISSTRIKARLKSYASAKRTELANADFRSISEIKEYLNEVFKQYSDYMSRLNRLAKEFNKQTAAPDDDLDGMFYDSSNRGKSGRGYTSSPDANDHITVEIAPHDFTVLKKHFLNIENLSLRMDNLDTILAMLRTNFREDSDSKKLLTQTEALKTKIESGVAKAYNFMDKIASGLEPKYFKQTVESIISVVEQRLGGEYESGHEMVYLVPLEKKDSTEKAPQYDLEFVHYFGMEGAHPSFKYTGHEDVNNSSQTSYLIFVGVVDMESMQLSMYVTYADTFIPPHKVIFGRNNFSNAKTGVTKALAVLSLNFFSSALERPALPETQQNIKKALSYESFNKYISSLSVNDEVITIVFKPSIASKHQADDLANKITASLYNILRTATKKDARIKYRTFEGDTGYSGEFYLDLPSTKDLQRQRLDSGAINALRKILPLSDEEIRRLVQEHN